MNPRAHQSNLSLRNRSADLEAKLTNLSYSDMLIRSVAPLFDIEDPLQVGIITSFQQERDLEIGRVLATSEEDKRHTLEHQTEAVKRSILDSLFIEHRGRDIVYSNTDARVRSEGDKFRKFLDPRVLPQEYVDEWWDLDHPVRHIVDAFRVGDKEHPLTAAYFTDERSRVEMRINGYETPSGEFELIDYVPAIVTSRVKNPNASLVKAARTLLKYNGNYKHPKSRIKDLGALTFLWVQKKTVSLSEMQERGLRAINTAQTRNIANLFAVEIEDEPNKGIYRVKFLLEPKEPHSDLIEVIMENCRHYIELELSPATNRRDFKERRKDGDYRDDGKEFRYTQKQRETIRFLEGGFTLQQYQSRLAR